MVSLELKGAHKGGDHEHRHFLRRGVYRGLQTGGAFRSQGLLRAREDSYPSARKIISWRTSALRSSKKFVLGAALLLYHRLGRLRGGYRIAVQVHDLPGAIFGSENHCVS